MSCELAEFLIEGIDYELLSNRGQIKFLSTGALGSAANIQDLGNVTPTILSPGEAFWSSGAALAAGEYRVEYVNGAMEYAPCTPNCWSVNTIGAGFKVKYNGGATEVDFPASTSTFATQAEAEAANAGKFIDIMHTGGTLGIFLFDTAYADNISGAPNPTFKLLKLGPPCAVEIEYDCPGPLEIPCSHVIKECLPCNDDPVANFSAEGPDSDRFSFIFRAALVPPLGGNPVAEMNRLGHCYSEISEQDAEDCARQQAENDLTSGFRVFYNTFQSCTVPCPTGGEFTYVVPSGTVLGFTQGQANQQAHGLACQRARLNKVCITTTLLNPACLNADYSMTLRATGGTPFLVTWQNIVLLPINCTIHIGDTVPYLWTITLGELPHGLVLNPCTGVISGTPTEATDVSITVRATDATGSFFQKDFVLVVGEIITSNPLPDALQGAPYSKQLVIDGSIDHERDVFTITDGDLPDGLTLSMTGLISGTTTAPLAGYLFTVRCIFPAGAGMAECSKQFMLSVVPSLLSYWKMDELAGTRLDTVGTNNLTEFAPVAAVVGVISNAAIAGGGSGIQKLGASGLWVYSRGITMTGWFKFTALGNGGNFGTAGFSMNGAVFEIFRLFANQAGQLVADARTSLGVNSQVALSGVVLNTFQFYRLWVDPADNMVHCKINEGPTHTGAVALSPATIPVMNITVTGTPLGNATTDEVAIWGRLLSDADGAALYAGGLGARPPFP